MHIENTVNVMAKANDLLYPKELEAGQSETRLKAFGRDFLGSMAKYNEMISTMSDASEAGGKELSSSEKLMLASAMMNPMTIEHLGEVSAVAGMANDVSSIIKANNPLKAVSSALDIKNQIASLSQARCEYLEKHYGTLDPSQLCTFDKAMYKINSIGKELADYNESLKQYKQNVKNGISATPPEISNKMKVLNALNTGLNTAHTVTSYANDIVDAFGGSWDDMMQNAWDNKDKLWNNSVDMVQKISNHIVNRRK